MKQAQVEDIYELSPMQQGILFHTLYEPESGVYLRQWSCALHGSLNRSALERAWQQAVEQHPILRTSFHWEELDRSLQVVQRAAVLPLEQHDWRSLDPAEQEARLEAYLHRDRARGFDLSQAPLMRLAFIQRAADVHQLIWSHHQLLLDGWSSSLLLQEVSARYEALCRGGELRYRPSRPYGDYIEWLQQQDRSEAEAFWRAALAGFTTPTPLGVGRPAGGFLEPPETGEEQQLDLPPATTAALQALARQQQLTLNTLVQGAWALLLSRYSGEEEVVFGITSAGRPAALTGVETMVGVFTNTLPLRVRLPSEALLLPWLKDLQAQQFELREHEYCPLVEIQGWSEVPRGLSLFESILVFENYPVDRSLQVWGDNLKIENRCSLERVNYPLTVIAVPGAALSLRINYDRQRFDPATIRRMLGHLQTLLEGMVADPFQRLASLPFLTAAERQQLLVEWNDTARDYPRDRCIHALFEAQVERSPEALAAQFEDQQLTYRELNARANRLAHHLRGLGVGPEVLVGLCVERSLEMVVGLLGILKAGGTYVPLDPAQPGERLAFMLAQAHAPVLVTNSGVQAFRYSGDVAPTFWSEYAGHRSAATQGAGATDLPERLTLVCLDTDWDTISREATVNPTSGVEERNLAYVIFTSGSTGRPKGVAVEHRQLVQYVAGILERLQIPPGASFAIVSSFATDLGHTALFPTLTSGGCLHVISRERIADGAALADYLARHPIDCLKIVPSHLAALQAGPHPERLMPRQCLVLGGEVSRSAWAAELQALAPGCAIHNHYGPTETTVGALTYRLDPTRPPLSTPTVPLGRPLANAEVYVLDAELQPVPVEVPGEIYVGGIQVARGYRNRPDLTAERFSPHPFSREPGTRLYRTGDRARWLPDGNLEFLGRVDHQVKIRGYRIEPGEVEAALREHPDLREVAVDAREDRSGDPCLVAYAVPRPERAPTVAGKARCLLPNQLAVLQLNRNETDYLYAEIFARQAYLKHGIMLSDGACVVDVGANIGLFALFAQEVCLRPRLYCFEPNPAAFELLAINTSLYGVDARLFNCGLSRAEGTAAFTAFEGFSLFSGFRADGDSEQAVVKTYLRNQQRAGAAEVEHPPRRNDGACGGTLPDPAAALLEQVDEFLPARFAARTFTAPLRTLSSIIREEEIERIDLLKINVEKSELEVLAGIEAEDWRKIRQVVLEVDLPEHRAPIFALLEQHGFVVAVEQDPLLEGTPLCYFYAIRPRSGVGERLGVGVGAERGGALGDGASGRQGTTGRASFDVGSPCRPVAPSLRSPLLTAEELRQFLSQRLPDYMLPSEFVLLERLPRTPSGKVDRQALPTSTPGSRPATPFVPPRTPVEEQVAAIWADLLGHDRVSIHDRFFELGGHSLLATQVVARLRQAFPVELPLRRLFEGPTVASLAEAITQGLADRAEEEMLTGVLAELDELSEADAQHRLAGGMG